MNTASGLPGGCGGGLAAAAIFVLCLDIFIASQNINKANKLLPSSPSQQDESVCAASAHTTTARMGHDMSLEDDDNHQPYPRCQFNTQQDLRKPTSSPNRRVLRHQQHNNKSKIKQGHRRRRPPSDKLLLSSSSSSSSDDDTVLPPSLIVEQQQPPVAVQRPSYFERQRAAQCGVHAINNVLVPHGWATITADHMAAYASDIVKRAQQECVPLTLDDLLLPAGAYQCDLLETVLVSVGCTSRRLHPSTAGRELHDLIVLEAITAPVLGVLVGDGAHWWAVRRLQANDWEVADSQHAHTYKIQDTALLLRWCESKCTFFVVSRK